MSLTSRVEVGEFGTKASTPSSVHSLDELDDMTSSLKLIGDNGGNGSSKEESIESDGIVNSKTGRWEGIGDPEG